MDLNRRSVVAGAVGACLAAQASAGQSAKLRQHGVLLKVPDLDAALGFYGDGLGFPVNTATLGRGFAQLIANTPIYVEEVKNAAAIEPGAAHVYVALQTNDFDAGRRMLRAAGAKNISENVQEVAVGKVIYFEDPFGVRYSFMLINGERPPFSEPRIYNTGFHLPKAAIRAARKLVEDGFGFAAMTERYYPPSIPYLEANKSFAFMLHEHRPFETDWNPRRVTPDDIGYSEVFVTRDLTDAVAAAKAHGARVLDKRPHRFPMGERVLIEVPGGAPLEIWRFR